jgi:hypothetical protein
MNRSIWTLTTLLACGGGGGDGDGTATTTDSLAPGTVTGAATGTPTASTDCTTWVATYDLTNSKFFIDSTLDFTITVQEPYDDDENMGPGTMAIRFADVNGAAGDGPAAIVNYALTQDFITGNAVATVHTQLDNTASAECGVAGGSLSSTILTWAPGEMSDYCQNGQISCEGDFCGSFGTPPEDEPVVYDNVCTAFPLNQFTVSSDLSTISMLPVEVSNDGTTTTAMTYEATLIDVVADPNSPACFCGG